MFSDNSPATDQVWKEGVFLVGEKKRKAIEVKTAVERIFVFNGENPRRVAKVSKLMLEKEDGKYR
jgi:hypothetical protein